MKKNNKNQKNNQKKKTERKEDGKSDQPDKGAQPERRAPPPTPARTLVETLSRFRFCVSNDSKYLPYLEELGLPIVHREGWTDLKSDHPITHYCRDWAQLIVFNDAAKYAVKEFLVVWDHFGRARVWSLPHHVPGIGLVIQATRPREYAGDAARAPADQDPALGFPHVGMLVDIYQHGDAKHALTADAVAEVAEGTRARVCYVVRHDLHETFGSHVYKGTVQTDDGVMRVSTLEGSWESIDGSDHGVNGRLVSFRPGPKTNPYPLHPYEDWLVTGAVRTERGWLHMSQIASAGPYQVWKCVLREDMPAAVLPVEVAPARYRDVTRLGLSDMLSARLDAAFACLPSGVQRAFDVASAVPKGGRRGLFVHHGIVVIDEVVLAALNAQLNFREVNGRVMQTLLVRGEEEMAASPLGPVRTTYPRAYYCVLTNTVLYAVMHRPDNEVVGIAHDAVKEHDHAGLKGLAAGKWVPRGPLGWTSILAFFGGAATLALLYKLGWLGRLAKWAAGWIRSSGPAGYLRKQMARTQLRLVTESGTMSAVEKVNCENVLKCQENEYKCLSEPLTPQLKTRRHYLGTACEEVMKSATGIPGAVILSIVEALSPYVAFRSQRPGRPDIVAWKHLLVMRGPATVFHLGTAVVYKLFGAKAMLVTIPCHWVFNHAVGFLLDAGYFPGQYRMLAWAEATPDELVEAFKRVWNHGAEEVMAGPVRPLRLRGVPTTPDFRAKLQDWRADYIHVSIDRRRVSLQEACELLWPRDCANENVEVIGEECHTCAPLPPTCWSWGLVLTSGQLWQPLKDGWSLIGCHVLRDFVDPFGCYKDVVTELVSMMAIREELAPVKAYMQTLKAELVSDEDWFTIEECAAALGGYKGEAFRAADEDVKAHGRMGKTRGQTKYNECLKLSKLVHGMPTVKSRSVKNVSTHDQTDILPVSRLTDMVVKRAFDGSRVFRIGRFQVRIVVAHATPDLMQHYAKLLAEADDLTIVVSCDDTILATGRYALEFGFGAQETDYESYDQSQSRPFFEVTFDFVNDLTRGRLERFEEVHNSINAMPIKGEVKDPWTQSRVTIRALIRYCMRTGVGTTSGFGSLNNVAAHVKWLLMCSERMIPFEEACARLCLVAKVKRTLLLDGSTFLRGWYLEASWNVLPSCVLKLGKIMKDPELLLRLPAEEAYGAVFFAIMSSVMVPDEYPIVGAFVQLARKFRAHASRRAEQLTRDRYIVEDAQYKVRCASTPRSIVLDAMYDRYGVTEAEVCEAEEMILSQRSLPCVVLHPVFARMRDVDYA